MSQIFVRLLISQITVFSVSFIWHLSSRQGQIYIFKCLQTPRREKTANWRIHYGDSKVKYYMHVLIFMLAETETEVKQVEHFFLTLCLMYHFPTKWVNNFHQLFNNELIHMFTSTNRKVLISQFSHYSTILCDPVYTISIFFFSSSEKISFICIFLLLDDTEPLLVRALGMRG